MRAVQHPSAARGLAALLRLASRPAPEERCELCAALIPEQHQHLVELERQRLVCTCGACAILFDHPGATKYRRVPRDIRELAGIEIDDSMWKSLGIPIGLAFFFRSSVANKILAVYPSPGGPTETVVDDEVWLEFLASQPSVGAIADDVQAMLVNRIRGERAYFIVPIDECYKLTGLIRSHWSGFTGGDRLWDELTLFFDGLHARALPARSAGHA